MKSTYLNLITILVLLITPPLAIPIYGKSCITTVLSRLIDQENYFINSKIVEIRRFPVKLKLFTAGGKKHIGVLENREKVIIREKGYYTGTIADISRTFDLKPEYDVAAYQLSKLLGFDIVPPTSLRNISIEGKNKTVSVQAWVDESKNFSSIFGDLVGIINPFLDSNPFIRQIKKAKKTRKKDLNRIFVLDYLANIHDRHGRNVLLDSKGRLVAIDNNLSFGPNIGGNITSPRFDKIILDNDIREKLLALSEEKLSTLKGLLTDEEISNILHRRDNLLHRLKEMKEELEAPIEGLSY